MSADRFLCHCCRGPLQPVGPTEASGPDLGHDPAALDSPPSAQGGPGDTPEKGSASSLDRDLEELPGSASSWHILGGDDDGEPSGDNPCTFTLLGRPAPGRTLGSIHRTETGLGDILSGDELGLPLCQDCTDGLLQQLDGQLAGSEADGQAYRRCCLQARGGCNQDARETLQRELEALELEEAGLARELGRVQEAGAGVSAALEAARAQTEALRLREARCRRDLGAPRWRRLELRDELQSLGLRLRRARAQLARLAGTDAFRATFAIGCRGPVGVINGRRLGRTPEVPVSWGEIGEAWGHAALLLAGLARAVGLRFRRFQLVPRGGRSYLRSLAPGHPTLELPLFCTRGRSALLDGRFDRAVAAFLDCLQQFQDRAGQAEPALCVPYRVRPGQGLVEDPGSGQAYSVRTRLHPDREWTKALKLMLTNFKWSLDWVSLRYRSRLGASGHEAKETQQTTEADPERTGPQL